MNNKRKQILPAAPPRNRLLRRHRVRSFDFPPCIDCGGCDFAQSNEEDCFENPHPVCGDCL